MFRSFIRKLTAKETTNQGSLAIYFNYNPDKYFYPGSTVKLPVAILALQKINKLKVKGTE